jgi:hypothetical protein
MWACGPVFTSLSVFGACPAVAVGSHCRLLALNRTLSVRNEDCLEDGCMAAAERSKRVKVQRTKARQGEAE